MNLVSPNNHFTQIQIWKIIIKFTNTPNQIPNTKIWIAKHHVTQKSSVFLLEQGSVLPVKAVCQRQYILNFRKQFEKLNIIWKFVWNYNWLIIFLNFLKFYNLLFNLINLIKSFFFFNILKNLRKPLQIIIFKNFFVFEQKNFVFEIFLFWKKLSQLLFPIEEKWVATRK